MAVTMKNDVILGRGAVWLLCESTFRRKIVSAREENSNELTDCTRPTRRYIPGDGIVRSVNTVET
jgi:hypothetical protein